jgi:hypothetical protein
MYSVKLAWKNFNVDLPSIEAWARALSPSYKGNSADTGLTLWFDSDPEAIPMHDVTHQESQPVLDEQGNPVLDADGNPETHMVDVTVSEPTGEPSIAQQCRAKWDSIQSNSPEAIAYTNAAQLAAVKAQVAKINAFSADLLAQFNAENIMLGITQDGKTEQVLDAMAGVLVALQSGSPTVAISRAKAIPSSSYDSKYVTAARLLQYVNRIEAFLGLPLSSAW